MIIIVKLFQQTRRFSLFIILIMQSSEKDRKWRKQDDDEECQNTKEKGEARGWWDKNMKKKELR